MTKEKSKESKPKDQPDLDLSEFFDLLAEKGVENIAEFRDVLLQLLRKRHDEKVTVRKLFPNFEKDSKAHEFLRSLSANKLVQPVGGGKWKKESTLRFTKDGRAIARDYNIFVTPLVFVSYAHEDEMWKNLLMRHLGVLGNSAHLEPWEDEKISTGQDFKDVIVDALEVAEAAVLLISASFLSSKFIQEEEIPRILKDRSNYVLPLLVRPCAWNTVEWLSQMKVHRAEGGKALSEFTEERPLSEEHPHPAIERCLSDFTEQIAICMKNVCGINSD